MPRWSEFGEQVNRLVYTLAGCKFHGNVEGANRFLAERTNYSEASVRAMRQGRFRPRDERSLETLVEIGAVEAGLGREWAYRLLTQAQHPDSGSVLKRFFVTDALPPIDSPSETHSRRDWFAWRVLGGAIGGLLALVLWSFGISKLYPAPHELPVLLEAIWGFLVGGGLALGLAVTDALVRPDAVGADADRPFAAFAFQYFALPLSGIAGALLWNIVAAPLFRFAGPAGIRSTLPETLLYGVVYGLSFGVGTLIALGRRALRLQLGAMLMFVAAMAAFATAGFLLATAQPAFANQKDIDLVVGIFFRIGLVLPVAAFFPPLGRLWSGDIANRTGVVTF